MWNLHVIFTSGLSLRKLNIYIFHSATESAAVIIKQLDNVHKKKHDKLISTILCVEFPKVQYIELCEKVQFVNADNIVISGG